MRHATNGVRRRIARTPIDRSALEGGEKPVSDVTLESLTKAYGDEVAVDEIDLTIRDGEILGVVGPSGCGKTTTLRTIAGFETPTYGRGAVRRGRRDARPTRRAERRPGLPVLRPVRHHDRPRERRVRAEDAGGSRRPSAASGPTTCSLCSTSPNWPTGGRRRCRAASNSGSASRGRSRSNHTSSCSTNR